MTEAFVVILLILKWFGVINISWTTAIVVSVAVIVIEIRIYLVHKALAKGLIGVADVVDANFTKTISRLNLKEDKHDFDS